MVFAYIADIAKYSSQKSEELESWRSSQLPIKMAPPPYYHKLFQVDVGSDDYA